MLARRPIAEVFSVFEDPNNLTRVTPEWLNLKVTNAEPVRMRQGAEIIYRIRWAGLRLHWKTLITEYEPPHFFVDEQVEGPYRLWRHRHTFSPSAAPARKASGWPITLITRYLWAGWDRRRMPWWSAVS